MIVSGGDGRHNPAMRLFLPDARALSLFAIVGCVSIGYALYLRYGAVEQVPVALACFAGLDSWLCTARQLAVALFSRSLFGWTALAMAAANLLRPSLALFAAALAVACLGVVLYNTGLSSLAAGLLILSLARRAPETD